MTYKKKPTKKKSPDKSKFEKEVWEFYGKKWDYEKDIIPYVVPESKHKYLPDFTIKENFFVECKGYLDADTRKKHLLLKEQHPDKRIIMLFMNCTGKIHPKSTTTYGEWATKNGIEWYCWKCKKPKKELFEDA